MTHKQVQKTGYRDIYHPQMGGHSIPGFPEHQSHCNRIFMDASATGEFMGYPSNPYTVTRDSGDNSVSVQKRSIRSASDEKHRSRPVCPGVPGKPPGQTCPYILDHSSSSCSVMSKWEDFSKHLKLGEGMTKALKGKLTLGAKIVTKGGKENYFKELFPLDGPEEKLVKTCSCYLSTTTGPVAGVLFISTHKVAFCSERSLLFFTPSGGAVRTHYLVSIPLKMVIIISALENPDKGEKYIEIQTVDKYEFWFLGFFNFHKALKFVNQVFHSHNPHAQFDGEA